MLIIEGLDATGKSTLANIIASEYNMKIQESEGAPKSQDEITSRVQRYFKASRDTLFVRHPCVSNPIYDIGRKDIKITISQDLMDEFYRQRHLFIYCERVRRDVEHVVNANDTPEHLAMINDPTIDRLMHIEYQQWALKHAHIIYRIGDRTDRIIDMLESVI